MAFQEANCHHHSKYYNNFDSIWLLYPEGTPLKETAMEISNSVADVGQKKMKDHCPNGAPFFFFFFFFQFFQLIIIFIIVIIQISILMPGFFWVSVVRRWNDDEHFGRCLKDIFSHLKAAILFDFYGRYGNSWLLIRSHSTRTSAANWQHPFKQPSREIKSQFLLLTATFKG